MGHIRPDDVRPFVGHPKLRAAIMGLGSFKRNAVAAQLLGVSGQFRDPFAFV
jgi:hypothetical protein